MAEPVDVAAVERWVREFARKVHDEREALTALDAAIGDADHGTNLDRGMTAVVATLDTGTSPDAGALLKSVAMTLISTVGGASGPLYGTFFLRASTAVGAVSEPDAPGVAPGVAPAALAQALRAGLDGVLARGRAVPGDKTMIDALAPACDALDAAVAAGSDLGTALAAARAAAEAGRDATVPMLARKGRASYLGERSIGHQDPGATSAALLIAAAEATLGAPSGPGAA